MLTALPAVKIGCRTVKALPMRLRDQIIGALNLFRAEPGPFDPADLRIAQALASRIANTPREPKAAYTALKEEFEKRGDHWIAKRDPAG